MKAIADERLREMIGMNVPCVPATGAEVASMVHELIAARHAEYELVEANQLLRSAYSIATRKGEETYWTGFVARVKDALDRQLPMVNAINQARKP
jgi:hypothetical protein